MQSVIYVFMMISIGELTLLVEWQEGHPACKELSGGGDGVFMIYDADLDMAQLMPLPLRVSCFSKSRLVLPFWYSFTRVVPDEGH